MKVYIQKPGPLSAAFLQVVSIPCKEGLTETKDQGEADLVLITGVEDLRLLYNNKQIFCVLLTDRRDIVKSQPENVCVVDTLAIFKDGGGVPKLIDLLKQREVGAGKVEADEEPAEELSDLVHFGRRFTVLVIDDTEKNRKMAEIVLQGISVTTARSLEDAIKKMSQRRFDAVLTDMMMPPDKTYSSLNLSRYGVTETVEYGFAVIFEATKRGIPVAVVTDGNHHENWVSAMFDRLTGATVNGQKVLFFNNIGKRWDKALKALLEE